MIRRHCDRVGCANSEPASCDEQFYELEIPIAEIAAEGVCYHSRLRHFCSTDCLMFWASTQPAGVPHV